MSRTKLFVQDSLKVLTGLSLVAGEQVKLLSATSLSGIAKVTVDRNLQQQQTEKTFESGKGQAEQIFQNGVPQAEQAFQGEAGQTEQAVQRGGDGEIQSHLHNGFQQSSQRNPTEYSGADALQQEFGSSVNTNDAAFHFSLESDASDASDHSLLDAFTPRAVPESRFARLMQFGGCFFDVYMNCSTQLRDGCWIKLWCRFSSLTEDWRCVAGALFERSFINNSKGPTTNASNNIFVNEDNAKKLINSLCRMRGAALKIAQMLSIQGAKLCI